MPIAHQPSAGTPSGRQPAGSAAAARSGPGRPMGAVTVLGGAQARCGLCLHGPWPPANTPGVYQPCRMAQTGGARRQTNLGICRTIVSSELTYSDSSAYNVCLLYGAMNCFNGCKFIAAANFFMRIQICCNRFLFLSSPNALRDPSLRRLPGKRWTLTRPSEVGGRR